MNIWRNNLESHSFVSSRFKIWIWLYSMGSESVFLIAILIFSPVVTNTNTRKYLFKFFFHWCGSSLRNNLSSLRKSKKYLLWTSQIVVYFFLLMHTLYSFTWMIESYLELQQRVFLLSCTGRKVSPWSSHMNLFKKKIVEWKLYWPFCYHFEFPLCLIDWSWFPGALLRFCNWCFGPVIP